MENSEKLIEEKVLVFQQRKQMIGSEQQGYIGIYAYFNELKIIPYQIQGEILTISQPISIRLNSQEILQIIPINSDKFAPADNFVALTYYTGYMTEYYFNLQVYKIDMQEKVLKNAPNKHNS